MEQVNGFGEAELVLRGEATKIPGMQEYFDASTDEMKLAIISGTEQWGSGDDLDNIIRATFVRPIFTLRGCGWTDEQILSASSYELTLATRAKYGYQEFKDLLTKLHITESTDEAQATLMLQKKADIFECELGEKYLGYKKYLEAMHPTVSSDVRYVKQLLAIAYVEEPTEWYLRMLAGIDRDILERLLQQQGYFPLRLCLLPFLESGVLHLSSITGTGVFWVHVDVGNKHISYPIYRWDLVWKACEGLGKVHIVCSDTEVYIYDQYRSRYQYGTVAFDTADPVIAFVDTVMSKLKLDTPFSEEEKYSYAFFAAKEILAGGRDWYLYLRYPEVFSQFAGINNKVTIAGLIRFIIPKEHKRNVNDLCDGLIQIGDRIMTIYVAYASGAIQECLDRGEVINVGCSKEKTLSFNDYATDFVNWMQQRDE